MSFGLSITQEDFFIAFVAVLQEWLGPNVDVIRSQDNRVPEPKCDNFVLMTPFLQQRLNLNNITTYVDTDEEESRTETKKTSVTVQLDVHGPQSADNVGILQTMLRTDLACALFAEQDMPGAVLYTSDPRQMPYKNEAQQIESRWILDVVLQVDFSFTVPQQFADQASMAGIINVDVAYPPT